MPAELLNKLGLAELEMGNIQLARAYFQRAVKMNRKDADAWNNLGASEYLDGKAVDALSDYKRAVKLDRHKAVFHANLANAYFDAKDYHGARREIAAALELDPKVFDRQRHRRRGGACALVQGPWRGSPSRWRRCMRAATWRSRCCTRWRMAAEAGMDVQIEMQQRPGAGAGTRWIRGWWCWCTTRAAAGDAAGDGERGASGERRPAARAADASGGGAVSARCHAGGEDERIRAWQI